MRPMTPQKIVNESRQKTEVNLEKESDRQEKSENNISVGENKPRPSGKSKGVSLLTMLATKDDLREFSEDPSLIPIVLMHKGEFLVCNDMLLCLLVCLMCCRNLEMFSQLRYLRVCHH